MQREYLSHLWSRMCLFEVGIFCCCQWGMDVLVLDITAVPQMLVCHHPTFFVQHLVRKRATTFLFKAQLDPTSSACIYCVYKVLNEPVY
jgi:hypothetical protein